jgi:hypothetical protein
LSFSGHAYHFGNLNKFARPYNVPYGTKI